MGFTQTRSTYRTHGPRTVTLLQTVTSACALMPSSRWSSLMKKRSSPLISTRALSSEGLCYGILGSLRQETSALITHRTGETVQIFR